MEEGQPRENPQSPDSSTFLNTGTSSRSLDMPVLHPTPPPLVLPPPPPLVLPPPPPSIVADLGPADRCLLSLLDTLESFVALPSAAILEEQGIMPPQLPTASEVSSPAALTPTDACQLLVSVLAGATLKQNVPVMISALMAMTRLTSQRGPGAHAVNRLRLGNLGACTVVMDLLRSRPTNIVLLRQLMTATWYLSREDHNMEMIEAADDGYNLILEVQRSFPLDLALQSASCAAIGNLAHNPRAQRRLGDLGVCELVAASIRGFPTEPELQSSGWAAVTNLTGGYAANQNRFLLAGACELLAKTMQDFVGDKDVQDHCCGAVTNLCGGTVAVAQRLTEAGVGDLVLTNLRSFHDDPAMQYAGLGALTRLASDSPGAREQLVAKGAIERILAALLTFPEDRDVQVWGCDAIGVFAEDFDLAAQLGVEGACEVVIAAMSAFYNDSELPDFGTRAIMLLATRPFNKEVMRSLGVKNVVERATNARFADRSLRHRARQALLAVGDWGMAEDFDDQDR